MKKLVKKSETGIALILVILALAIMLLMALSVSSTSTTEVQISDASVRESTAHYLAEAGLNQVLAMVRNLNNGDINDLLAGPDAQCASPCTASGSSWATISPHPLSSHGNELVINNAAGGTGSATQWASVADGKVMMH